MEYTLLLISDRKAYAAFRLVSRSVSFTDLEYIDSHVWNFAWLCLVNAAR